MSLIPHAFNAVIGMNMDALEIHIDRQETCQRTGGSPSGICVSGRLAGQRKQRTGGSRGQPRGGQRPGGFALASGHRWLRGVGQRTGGSRGQRTGGLAGVSGQVGSRQRTGGSPPVSGAGGSRGQRTGGSPGEVRVALSGGSSGSADRWLAWRRGDAGSADRWLAGSADRWLAAGVSGQVARGSDRWLAGQRNRWLAGSADRWLGGSRQSADTGGSRGGQRTKVARAGQTQGLSRGQRTGGSRGQRTGGSRGQRTGAAGSADSVARRRVQRTGGSPVAGQRTGGSRGQRTGGSAGQREGGSRISGTECSGRQRTGGLRSSGQVGSPGSADRLGLGRSRTGGSQGFSQRTPGWRVSDRCSRESAEAASASVRTGGSRAVIRTRWLSRRLCEVGIGCELHSCVSRFITQVNYKLIVTRANSHLTRCGMSVWCTLANNTGAGAVTVDSMDRCIVGEKGDVFCHENPPRQFL
nr:uncharacterized transmembrane protein DDB_G0289901-like [Penaeus vannamei]